MTTSALSFRPSPSDTIASAGPVPIDVALDQNNDASSFRPLKSASSTYTFAFAAEATRNSAVSYAYLRRASGWSTLRVLALTSVPEPT